MRTAVSRCLGIPLVPCCLGARVAWVCCLLLSIPPCSSCLSLSSPRHPAPALLLRCHSRVGVLPVTQHSTLLKLPVSQLAPPCFRWEEDGVVRGGVLVYNTGRSLESFEQLMAEKSAVLAHPDMLISAVGTKIYKFENGCACRHSMQALQYPIAACARCQAIMQQARCLCADLS
jgi:hypothetical protein